MDFIVNTMADQGLSHGAVDRSSSKRLLSAEVDPSGDAVAVGDRIAHDRP